jgi:hypothetical protein
VEYAAIPRSRLDDSIREYPNRAISVRGTKCLAQRVLELMGTQTLTLLMTRPARFVHGVLAASAPTYALGPELLLKLTPSPKWR